MLECCPGGLACNGWVLPPARSPQPSCPHRSHRLNSTTAGPQRCSNAQQPELKPSPWMTPSLHKAAWIWGSWLWVLLQLSPMHWALPRHGASQQWHGPCTCGTTRTPGPPHLPKGAHATTCSAFHKSGAIHWRLAPLNISWYCLKHKHCHRWL